MQDSETRRGRSITPWLIYLAAVALYAWAGTKHEVPLISPDEPAYGNLARSVGSGMPSCSKKSSDIARS